MKPKANIETNYTKQLMSLTLPIATQQFLLAAVGAGDSLMLGLVNSEAMAAVSLANNIEFIENLFINAIVCGATILASQYYGKGDNKTIEKIFSMILKYAAVICIVFTLIASIFSKQLMALFTDDSTLISLGSEYVTMAVGSYLVSGISQCYLCIMKTTGQTKQSVLISTFSMGLDTILNAVFIFAFNMHASGAAITTSITRMIELAIILIFSKKMIVLPKASVKIPFELHKDFVKCSIPHLINSLLWGLGTAVYSSIIGHLGTAITTAYSVSNLIRNFASSISRGLGQGTEILMANILGADKIKDAKFFGKKLVIFSILSGILCGILALIIGFILSQLMALTDEAQQNLRIMIFISAFYMLSQCINIVVICGIFSAGGDTAFDAYSVAVTMWIIIIPIALICAFYFKLPAIWVYVILSMDEVVKIPWVFAHYKKHKWLKNLTDKTVPEKTKC